MSPKKKNEEQGEPAREMESRVENVERELTSTKTSLAAMQLKTEAQYAAMYTMRKENAENHSKLFSLLSRDKGNSSQVEGEQSVGNNQLKNNIQGTNPLQENKKIMWSESQGEDLVEFRQSVKKVELPMFSGEDPAGWITRAEVYFGVQGTSDMVRVKLAQLCMEGSIIHFFNSWANEEEELTWECFKEALLERFGSRGEGNIYV